MEAAAGGEKGKFVEWRSLNQQGACKMTKLDPDFVANAVKILIENQIKNIQDSAGMGKATEFRCHCGGVFHRFDPFRAHLERLRKEMGKPRFSRKKRQSKKNHKKWRKTQEANAFLTAAMVHPIRCPMSFKCGSCGTMRGFYSMMAHAMFSVEPMPQGGLACY